VNTEARSSVATKILASVNKTVDRMNPPTIS
jgi:hypothetical protein